MFTTTEIQNIESLIGYRLPADVVREAMDQSSPFWGEIGALRFNFITAKEHQLLETFYEDLPLSQIPELKALWADSESNFVGMFMDGPMLGHLALIGHDTNIDCAPLYRNLKSFIEAMKSGSQNSRAEWPYQVDYPNMGDEIQASIAALDIESDIVCIRKIEAMLTQSIHPLRNRFLNSCIVSLTPREEAARLVPMLDSPDHYICGRACSVLGCFNYEEACAKMCKIALGHTNPARARAIAALGMMKIPRAKQMLLELVRTGIPLQANITTALRHHGFEVKFEKSLDKENMKWYARFSEADNWEDINIESTHVTQRWFRL